jgi:hypothetical protein
MPILKINAPGKAAIVLGLGLLMGAALLPAMSAHAAKSLDGINPPPAPSTPSCGLGKGAYPDCPVGSDDERIAEGFRIAPVALDLSGLDPRKVGVGAYWVNSAGACDGCHSSPTLGGEYTADGNPQKLPINLGGTYAYSTKINPYNPPAIINTAAYLAGGNNFGNVNCDNAGGGGGGPELIVRNITPDWSTGVPLAAGLTLAQFKTALKTGHDAQQVHLNCPPIGNGTPPACLNAPADGTKLNVMPWPALSNATDYDLESIYAYLTSIPCISNAGSQYPQIVHTCPGGSQANRHKYSYDKGRLTQLD